MWGVSGRDRLSVVAPIVPDPRKIKSFRIRGGVRGVDEGESRSRGPEVWVKIHKKGSGLPSVTAAEALDVVLCWGWIDGIRKGFDERSFLQRSPAAAAQYLEPGQPRQHRPVSLPQAAWRGWAAAGGRGESRWALGRRLCADSQRERGHDSRRICATRSRPMRAREESVPHARPA